MSSMRILSPEQAARLIYNTRTPSRDQVEGIRDKIERGTLVRSPRGGVTTTPDAVADYLAHRAAGKQAPRDLGTTGGEAASTMYRTILRDYFLAVLMQRTVRKRTSGVFQAAVVAMQIVIVLLPIAAAVWVYRTTLTVTKTPEQIAVEAWLTEQYHEYEIESLAPYSSSASAVRVKFWYAMKTGKRIQSDRVFTLAGGEVANVEMTP